MKKKSIIVTFVVFVLLINIGMISYFIYNNNSASAYVKKAVECYKLQQYVEAIKNYEKAISLDKNNPKLYLGKMNAEIKLNKEDEAIKTSEEMISVIENNNESNNESNKEYPILEQATDSFCYKDVESVLLMFYEKCYGMEEYKDTLDFIENYLSENYGDELNEIKSNYNDFGCYIMSNENWKTLKHYMSLWYDDYNTYYDSNFKIDDPNKFAYDWLMCVAWHYIYQDEVSSFRETITKDPKGLFGEWGDLFKFDAEVIDQQLIDNFGVDKGFVLSELHDYIYYGYNSTAPNGYYFEGSYYVQAEQGGPNWDLDSLEVLEKYDDLVKIRFTTLDGMGTYSDYYCVIKIGKNEGREIFTILGISSEDNIPFENIEKETDNDEIQEN